MLRNTLSCLRSAGAGSSIGWTKVPLQHGENVNLHSTAHGKVLSIRCDLSAPMRLSTNQRSFVLAKCEGLRLAGAELDVSVGYVPKNSQHFNALPPTGTDSSSRAPTPTPQWSEIMEEMSALYTEELLISRKEITRLLNHHGTVRRALGWECRRAKWPAVTEGGTRPTLEMEIDIPMARKVSASAAAKLLKKDGKRSLVGAEPQPLLTTPTGSSAILMSTYGPVTLCSTKEAKLMLSLALFHPTQVSAHETAFHESNIPAALSAIREQSDEALVLPSQRITSA